MEEGDKEKTAFIIGKIGFYQCSCMAISLTNAPWKFQWLMEQRYEQNEFESLTIF